MKNLLVLVATLLSAQAFAGTQTIKAGQTARFSDCGGTMATKMNNNGQIVLNFVDINACSLFDIVRSDESFASYEEKKLEGENHYKYGNYTIPMNAMGSKSVTITLQSGSGKTSEKVTILLPSKKITASHTINFGSSINMGVCGGRLDTNNGKNNDQLNLVFSNLRDCSVFDIVKEDGNVDASYADKPIAGSNGNYSQSFTIPKRFLSILNSTVKVAVKSADGNRVEYITIKYFRL